VRLTEAHACEVMAEGYDESSEVVTKTQDNVQIAKKKEFA
jgi:hypothetical protein